VTADLAALIARAYDRSDSDGGGFPTGKRETAARSFGGERVPFDSQTTTDVIEVP
jgi:hypothetical protein